MLQARVPRSHWLPREHLPRMVAIVASGAILASACAPAGPAPSAEGATAASVAQQSVSGSITIDGSSTVFPISEGMAEEFQGATGGRIRVTVGVSGTGGGFKRFCAGETDISDASRPIRQSETEQCEQNNIQFIELPVAYDGLSVMVNPRNTFVESMTVTELKKMWEPDAQGTVTRWSQIRQGWPDQEVHLYGPGTDSGTFDYFTEAINGKEKASRGDYTASEDDNVLVQGISSDPNALGYFGYAYYIENSERLKLVAIDDETGKPVLPSEQTISEGSYKPLSRPIFIYVKATALERPEVREFVRFYLDPMNARELVSQVGYVPFPERYYTMGQARVAALRTGSVFEGMGSTEGLKLDDLFR